MKNLNCLLMPFSSIDYSLGQHDHFDWESAHHATKEEIDGWLKTYKDGSAVLNQSRRQARDQLLASFLPLVKRVVRAMVTNESEYEDFEQEGQLAVLIALRKYHLDGGVSLESYVYDYIQSYIANAIEMKGLNMKWEPVLEETIKKVRKAHNKRLVLDGGDRHEKLDKWMVESLADDLEISLKKAREAVHADRTSAINLPGNGIEGRSDERLEPYSLIEKADGKRQVKKSLARLGNRRGRAVEMRYGIGQPESPEKPPTYQQIGSEIGVSRQRVLQLLHEALKIELVKPSHKKALMQYHC